ncbi:MAG TPA: PHP domain-containing protein [Caldilineaceae bacterium]|nr:PHP domain-containing protein [Caldilineaceae bacterium]
MSLPSSPGAPLPTAPYPVDLQLHSTCSDGTDTPQELVALAAARGLRVIALTDHDSVLGVAPAQEAGRRHGVWVLPALEFSTQSDRERDLLDINILAYGIDPEHPTLVETLRRVQESRVEQKIRQVERLQGYGVDVPVDEVLAAAQGAPGRVHIAQVALARNPDRFRSLQDVFEQYLAPDAPYPTYVARSFSLRVEEAIALTHMAGGLAVLAHPGIYLRVRDVDGMVRRLAAEGLDGLEVRYTYAQNRGHRGATASAVAALVAHFAGLADELRLLKTGGSDYHGAAKPGILPGQAGLTMDEWAALAATAGWEWTP